MHAEYYWILSFRGSLAIKLIALCIVCVHCLMECVSIYKRAIAAIHVHRLEDVCIIMIN